MSMNQMVKHYKKHSIVTNPGKYCKVFDQLAELSVYEIVNLVGGISAHYEKDLLKTGLKLGATRKKEIDIRFVENILDRVFEIDSRPLVHKRKLIDRYMGTCRDGAVLVCSILRQIGISARIRYGFVHLFLDPKKPLSEHIMIEYWDQKTEEWLLCEPRMNDELMEKYGITNINADNFPKNKFIYASDAWKEVRKNRRSAIKFSNLTFKESYGLWKIRNILMYDQASLLGFEPLMWDVWGYMIRAKMGMEPKWYFQLKLLDKIANYNLMNPEEWKDYMYICRKKRGIRISGYVKACSPENGDYILKLKNNKRLYNYAIS